MWVETARDKRGTVLIIEDHEGYAEHVMAPVFERDFDVQFAFNIPTGRKLLRSATNVRAVFVDLDLPGGTPFDPDRPGGFGFELVSLARRLYPVGTPVVVVTSHMHPRLINQAHTLGAEYIVKQGTEQDNLKLIADRLRSPTSKHNAHASAYLAGLAAELGLTSRQSEILNLSVTGMRHKEVARTLGISPNTLKRHVDGILRRSAARSMAELREQFRRVVWGDQTS